MPIQRGLLEMFEGEILPLSADPELHKKYGEWSASRDKFLKGLRERDPAAIKEGWQKDYTRLSNSTKVHVPEFSRHDQKPVAALATRELE
jgi:hypothetical protein